MSKVKKLYYAVNGSGQGMIFCSFPERDNHRNVWCGNMEGLYTRLVMQLESEQALSLPVLSWKDEPVVLELKLDIC